MPDASAVLAMIALNNGRVACARVLASLWPHLSELSAGQQLCDTLRRLRRDQPQIAGHMVQNRVALAWLAEADVRVDVHTFSAAVLRHDWSAAVAMYTGDFLEGNGLEWVVSMRAGLRLEYIYALDRLIEHCDLRRDFSQARLLSNRLIELEPARECGYQLVMRYSHLLGDFMGVASTFRRCQQFLCEHFGMEPSAATCSLYRACLAPASRIGEAMRMTAETAMALA